MICQVFGGPIMISIFKKSHRPECSSETSKERVVGVCVDIEIHQHKEILWGIKRELAKG